MPNSQDPKRLRKLAEASFPFFCCLIQGEEYFEDVHQELAEYLQYEVAENAAHRRGLVIMPRGTYKTTIATKLFAAWLALRNPALRILIVSNTDTNARQKIFEIRQLFDNHPLIRGLWPELMPDKNRMPWSDSCAMIRRPVTATWSEGTWEAAGLRTKLTGRHYDWIIEDDTVAPDLDDISQNMILPTREDINQAIGWHRMQATPLLIGAFKGGRLTVGTRWVHDDLIEYQLKHEVPEGACTVFERKAVENGVYIMRKLNLEALKDIERSMGKYMFSALYMNDPMRPEDMLFDPAAIEDCRYQTIDAFLELDWKLTVDPAISEKSDACDTAMVLAGHARNGPEIWVQDMTLDKLTPSATIAAIFRFHTQYPLSEVIIESNAYQKALGLAWMQKMRDTGTHMKVSLVNSRQSKDVRIAGLEPWVANRCLRIRRAKSLDQLVSQMVQYPHGALVDAVDACAMHLAGRRLTTPTSSEPEADSTDSDPDRVTLEDVLARYDKSRQLSHRPQSQLNDIGLVPRR